MHAGNGLGYVIRIEHIRAAIDKATVDERPVLDGLLDVVRELDELERSLPERVRKAQADAGIAKPELSKAAKDAITQSSDANREIDRLLTRKCSRAETAEVVIREILAVAREDMKAMNTLDNWIADEDPTKPVYSEAYRKRRKFVEALRALIA